MASALAPKTLVRDFALTCRRECPKIGRLLKRLTHDEFLKHIVAARTGSQPTRLIPTPGRSSNRLAKEKARQASCRAS